MRPFLKWAGGKFKIVDELKKYFPLESKRFIEPFLGAGAVALNVNYPKYIVNDLNYDLVLIWEMFKKMEMDFVKECKEFFTLENDYYELRKEFNNTNDQLRKATLFVYLNRHCYNGLCRYNSKGKFNSPKGSYEIVHFPQEEFEQSLKKVKKFEIYNKDFREIFNLVEDSDLIYCDPPYMPLSMSANFNGYTDSEFSLKDQLDLAQCAKIAAEKGATVIISNHFNWYTKQIYSEIYGAKINVIDVSRTISSKTSKRKPVKEIIAVFD